jgi:ABC-type antimicrobial peptide transport system permease subunit
LKPDGVPCTYVVGIAEDIRSQSIEAEPRLFYYYMSSWQWRPEIGSLFVRARSGDGRTMLEAVRRRLQREMPGTSYVTTRSMGDLVDVTMRSWIVGATVFTVFGALALMLAAVGLYSVIAYGVTQRTHELGVRLALGAARTSVVRLVVLGSLRFTIAGVVIGSVAALLAARWIDPLLFRQSPRDPVVFAVVTVVLVAVAIAASWIPALRAASVDPRTALQSD